MSGAPWAAPVRREPGQERYEKAVLELVDRLPPRAVVFVHSHAALIGMRSLILRKHGPEHGVRVIVAASKLDEDPIRSMNLRTSAPAVEFFRSPMLSEQRAYTAAVSALLERPAA